PDGWGELTSMRTPSGMLVHYDWGGGGGNPYGNSAGGAIVTQRAITHDRISDLVWTYNRPDPNRVIVTSPDGSSTTYSHWHDSHYGSPYLDSSINENNYGVGDVVYRID